MIAPRPLFADSRGKIREVRHLEAAGMAAGGLFRLSPGDLRPLPPTSELFLLPDRRPVAYDPAAAGYVMIESDGPGAVAVAAFVAPGYTVTRLAAYREEGQPALLPLFAYAACALYKGKVHVAAVRVDNRRCHDTRFMPLQQVRKGAAELASALPGNRLVAHLERCALVYGCPNAKNLFLGRYEAPLPTSPSCNARCAGCISSPPAGECAPSQPRIRFVPTPREIADIALWHIVRVPGAIVSFGQGCEGEPLLSAEAIEESIRIIRRHTSRGTIHMNTNGSRPDILRRLARVGLDSVRVSMNSLQPVFYQRYYRPRSYAFNEVLRSIAVARKEGLGVALNYLVMPGFTDDPREVRALERLLSGDEIDMIQWRNLNYDPLAYYRRIGFKVDGMAEAIGLGRLIAMIHRKFKQVKKGYFNKRLKKKTNVKN